MQCHHHRTTAEEQEEEGKSSFKCKNIQRIFFCDSWYMNRIEKWTKSWLDTKKKKRIFGAKIEKSKEKKKVWIFAPKCFLNFEFIFDLHFLYFYFGAKIEKSEEKKVWKNLKQFEFSRQNIYF